MKRSGNATGALYSYSSCGKKPQKRPPEGDLSISYFLAAIARRRNPFGKPLVKLLSPQPDQGDALHIFDLFLYASGRPFLPAHINDWYEKALAALHAYAREWEERSGRKFPITPALKYLHELYVRVHFFTEQKVGTAAYHFRDERGELSSRVFLPVGELDKNRSISTVLQGKKVLLATYSMLEAFIAPRQRAPSLDLCKILQKLGQGEVISVEVWHSTTIKLFQLLLEVEVESCEQRERYAAIPACDEWLFLASIYDTTLEILRSLVAHSFVHFDVTGIFKKEPPPSNIEYTIEPHSSKPGVSIIIMKPLLCGAS